MFLKQTVAPSRVVVSAVGVDHAKLVDMASAHFGSMPAGSPAPAAEARYDGGEYYIPGPADMGEVSFTLSGHYDDMSGAADRIKMMMIHSLC